MLKEVIVHLTFSGLIVLQPVKQPAEFNWRVVVPDFSEHACEKHEAFLAYEPTPGSAIQVVPLARMMAKIDDGTTAGASGIPEEMLDLRWDACEGEPDCGRPKEWAEFDSAPALQMWIKGGTLSASAVDTKVKWHFQRHNHQTGKPDETPKKGPNQWLAEEVCLTFVALIDETKPFELELDDGSLTKRTIAVVPELVQPDQRKVEIAFRNVGIHHHDEHEMEDPHFKMYYETMKVRPAREARLKNKDVNGGPHSNPHDHKLATVKSDGKVLLADDTRSPKATGKSRSMTGSNCPPGGGGWPYP